MRDRVPPGWPSTVRPPGADGWEQQAVQHLLDCCPPDFRGQPVLRRHPWVLAVFAGRCVQGQQAAARDGLAMIRAELADQVDPTVVDAALDLWQAESARLVRVAREIELLRQALAGERFVPTLAGRWDHRRG